MSLHVAIQDTFAHQIQGYMDAQGLDSPEEVVDFALEQFFDQQAIIGAEPSEYTKKIAADIEETRRRIASGEEVPVDGEEFFAKMEKWIANGCARDKDGNIKI